MPGSQGTHQEGWAETAVRYRGPLPKQGRPGTANGVDANSCWDPILCPAPIGQNFFLSSPGKRTDPPAQRAQDHQRSHHHRRTKWGQPRQWASNGAKDRIQIAPILTRPRRRGVPPTGPSRLRVLQESQGVSINSVREGSDVSFRSCDIPIEDNEELAAVARECSSRNSSRQRAVVAG